MLEETGIPVRVGRIAFLREWVVPRYTRATEPGDGYGFGIEVFHYAFPEEPVPDPRPEHVGAPVAKWVPLVDVSNLPLWPKELKLLCDRLQTGRASDGELESPLAINEHDPFELSEG